MLIEGRSGAAGAQGSVALKAVIPHNAAFETETRTSRALTEPRISRTVTRTARLVSISL